MAKIENAQPTQAVHGKFASTEDVYYYTDKDGNQRARKRVENYQQNRSPRQRWYNLAFGYAHQHMREAFADAAATQQVISDWTAANKIGPNGKLFHTARAWKFASFQQEWKTAHPFDQWYEDYIQHVSETVSKKTQSERTSTFMLQQQIDVLTAQVEQLTAQLRDKTSNSKK